MAEDEVTDELVVGKLVVGKLVVGELVKEGVAVLLDVLVEVFCVLLCAPWLVLAEVVVA